MCKKFGITFLYILITLSGCASANTEPSILNMESSSLEETSNSTSIVEDESSDIFLPQNSAGGTADTMLLIENLDDLEEHSDYIVKGVLQDDAELKTEKLVDTIYYAGMTSHIEITEVYKGDFQKGDSILLTEPYIDENIRQQYWEEQNIVLTRISNLNSYIPCEANQEYVFFLVESYGGKRENWRNTYLLQGEAFGKYPVPDDNDLSNRDFEEETGLSKSDSEIYEGIYEEVIEKYLQ